MATARFKKFVDISQKMDSIDERLEFVGDNEILRLKLEKEYDKLIDRYRNIIDQFTDKDKQAYQDEYGEAFDV